MGLAARVEPSVERFVSAPSRKMLIDGRWVEASSGKTFETFNPATGAVLAHVAEGDAEDVDRAVRAARRAFDAGPWPRMAPAERQKILLKVADLIEAHGLELAQLETLDNGKALAESQHVDIPSAAETFRYYAGWVNKLAGETNPTDPSFFNFTLREPVGVCGQVIPWNFPLLMAAWKLGPALACGNTVVLKPAEQTPLTALRLGELLQEAGVPDGVVNIVPGFGPTAGGAIVRHPLVDKVAFTGSTEVGKEIHRETASTLKRVSLELGGKSPNIVFADADVAEAVKGALVGVFFNQGEVCCAGTRLFVEEKLHDEFADAVTKATAAMTQGPGLDPGTQVGPLVSQEQLDRVTGYLEIGKREGARALTGGERNTAPGLEGGWFVKPTVFTGVRNDMRIAQEEIFGPVVALIPFKDETDAVLQGNDTLYGLAAGVWTRDVSKAHRVARAVRAGTVWVNCYNVFDVISPFGGYKQSGYGRELGRHALDLYTQVKSVWMRIEAMARVASFADIADEFQRRWQRTVWATMTTASRSGRLQSRLVHPLWESATGWVLTGTDSLKARHLRTNPYTSLTYWDQVNEQVHAECRTEFETRPEEKRGVWELFKTTPFPLGYDPALFFTEGPEGASVGVVRLVPWRIELWSLADLMSGKASQVWLA